jgi:phenylalanyl-tRNA synthetase beta chain
VKAPLNWLADYVAITLPIDELVYRLTMSGTEVEGVIDRDSNWDDVVVGEVVALEQPPQAERLVVATVDLGDRIVTAVTAAPNIAVGQKVPVVRVGGRVPCGPDGKPFVLQSRTMMGITGEAMVLSERELGLSDDHSGILVLHPDTPVGIPVASVMGGAVLEIAVNANRPDQQSLLGIAREIAAITDQALREPQRLISDLPIRQRSEPSAAVRVEAPDLCLRYSALRIDGVHVGPSPYWLANRLEAAGVRPINNIVDVTNFVMLELGQPLHAFDFFYLHGGEIIVRRALPGETLITLDGEERHLSPDMLVIADRDRSVAIAGVMGGQESEISSKTTSVLIESANFNRVSIRRTSRTLGLRTEASSRFERGIPPELTTQALWRCLDLMVQVMGEGSQLEITELVDVSIPLPELPKVEMRLSEFERLLGMQVSSEDVIKNLAKLGFASRITADGLLIVQPPYWRRDVEGPADVIEEVARMIGYDRIPETLPSQQTPPPPLLCELHWENAARETLWGIGMSEAYTDSLTSEESMGRLFAAVKSQGTSVDATDFKNENSELRTFREDWSAIVANPAGVQQRGATLAPIRLLNPLSRERSVLRLTLLPSLLDVIAYNLKHTQERLAFFEIARTYFPRSEGLPYERRTLSIALAGLRQPRSWNTGEHGYTFYDLKGMVATLLAHFGIDERHWHIEPATHPALHPGRSGRLYLDGSDVGYLGEIHPLVAERFEIEAPIRAYGAELDLDSLMTHAIPLHFYHPIPRVPTVKRDISLSFPEDVPARAIQDMVRMAGGDLLTSVRIVDVYHGEHVGPARKSITLALEFQSPERTLTQEEVNTYQQRIVETLERELGGQLRS